MIAAVALSAGAIFVGLATLTLVRDNPGGSLAGSSALAAVALVVAGWLLIGAGLGTSLRHRGNRVGVLLIAAGFAWFVTEWNNPGAGSSIVFTVGLICYTVCPPLVAHAAIAYPSGRLGFRVERAAVGVAYVASLGVLGLGPALVFEPEDQGCAQCPANLVAVTSDPDLVEALNRAGIWLGVAWTIVLAVLAVWQLTRSATPARRLTMPVVVPTIGFLGAVAATYVEALDRGFLSNDQLDHDLWLLQAGALVFVALGVMAEWVRVRKARTAVAGMVVELAAAPPTGGVRGALADTLGDPELEVAYPVSDGAYVDARGLPVLVDASTGRATTALVDEGDTIAVVIHRSDLLGDRRLVEDAVSAARLAFENERLHAEAAAQLVELRESRHRLVTASDAERRRLERDLHDGAQQRLVGLTLATRQLCTQLEQQQANDVAVSLAAAVLELRQAVDDVRTLASGLHPAVLTDYGLTAAVTALAETATEPLRVVTLTDERFPPAVEITAYLLLAEAAKIGAVSATVARRDDNLVVEVDTAAEPPQLIDVEDRVGALGGTMTILSTGRGVRVRAVIPCA